MNIVILKGNLTRDVELKFLPNSVAVANFGIATNKRWNDAQTGERREKATFVEITAWNKQAEVINEYFTKGSEILIQGELEFEQWQAPDGTNRNRLKVRLNQFEFVGSRESNGNGNGNGNAQQRTTPETAPPAPTTADNPDTTEDDVPF